MNGSSDLERVDSPGMNEVAIPNAFPAILWIGSAGPLSVKYRLARSLSDLGRVRSRLLTNGPAATAANGSQGVKRLHRTA
jgi:hypothetical protein